MENYSQTITFYFSDKEYIPTEIELSGGTMLNGLILDFRFPKDIEIGMVSSFQSFEEKLNLTKKHFKFKKNKESETEQLEIDKIKKISITDEDGQKITYEKLKLKTVNSKSEVIDLNRQILAPIIREGKINVYAYKMMVINPMMNNVPQFVGLLTYVKNNKDEYAYMPVDLNRVNIFNIGKIDDKFNKSFMEIGKDCKAFLEYFEKNKISYDSVDNETKKALIQDFKAQMKASKSAAKGAKNKQKAEQDFAIQNFLKVYYNYINKYEELCN